MSKQRITNTARTVWGDFKDFCAENPKSAVIGFVALVLLGVVSGCVFL